MGAELDLFAAVAKAAKDRRQIPIEGEYRKWASKSRITEVDSPNHGCAGSCPDLMNLANRQSTVLSMEAQRAKFQHWAETTLCGNEAFARSIYTRMNLDGYRIGRDLWREMGDESLAASLHTALRSALAHLALVSITRPPAAFSDSELAKDGNCLFIADDGVPDGAASLYACPAVGARSANDKPEGTSGRKPPPGAPSPVRNWNPPEPAVIVTEACKRRLSNIGSALVARGCAGHWLPLDESMVFDDAVHGDNDARKKLWAWAVERRTQDTFRLLIFEDSSAMLCTDAHASSTAPVEAAKIERATGRGRVAVANPVHRESQGGADNVRPTRGWIENENGLLVVYCQRVDGSLPAVSMALGKEADLIFDGENGPHGSKLHRAPWLVPDPNDETVDEPGPVPEVRKPDESKSKDRFGLYFCVGVAIAVALYLWLR